MQTLANTLDATREYQTQDLLACLVSEEKELVLESADGMLIVVGKLEAVGANCVLLSRTIHLMRHATPQGVSLQPVDRAKRARELLSLVSLSVIDVSASSESSIRSVLESYREVTRKDYSLLDLSAAGSMQSPVALA